MKIVLDSSLQMNLSLKPKNKAEAIAQQLYIIIKTMLGECPMYRDFGTDYTFKDMPNYASKSMYIGAITEAIQKFEPDVTLIQIDFTNKSDYGDILGCVIEVVANE